MNEKPPRDKGPETHGDLRNMQGTPSERIKEYERFGYDFTDLEGKNKSEVIQIIAEHIKYLQESTWFSDSILDRIRSAFERICESDLPRAIESFKFLELMEKDIAGADDKLFDQVAEKFISDYLQS